ncbi:hypothetical protein UA08_05394 [Talaromyces atroroseus]|uniref:Xylanolytic transcriptional activator regulatory domain-containing protein n=1 Tax=Talaromyces atroroseus TaxID=1441469 RepID=A0A225APZ8_TALAT|nr:hypothetical protein UA08_05394 [Talaromyces atroroseus]OKL59338.1 hypothetical protein UA08_05394 [Talaromyces atroroseus]
MESSDAISKSSEIGSLITHSNNESHFVGSSSGVFFVNTVRQAFAKSLGPYQASPAPAPEFPAPEDTIVGPPKSPQVKQDDTRSRVMTESRRTWTYDPHIAHLLGKAPALENARQLMMMYFKLWHPLFPFLHGPTFLQAMEAFYSESTATDSGFSNMMSEHSRACWTTILQSVFNISSILQPDLRLAQESKITSAASALKLVDVLVNRHDILSLQALLALQLYLVATMSLRSASLLGGAILRSILHAGFHRCPYRYQQLNSHDRQLRKRLFWCFYAVDRYLSQALGLPLGLQDSDIDVCLPGAHECHVVGTSSSAQLSYPSQLERTSEQATNVNSQDNLSQNMSWSSSKSPQKEQLNREAILAGYVMYGNLTGRALELFHKSIHKREVRRSAVLFLVSDVHKWWNNLPSALQGLNEQSVIDLSTHSHNEESSFDLSPFFSILYEHLILCINRPFLSLEPSSPDFCSGLQICISSARNILSSLKTQLARGQALFWPGLLSATYMAGTIFPFQRLPSGDQDCSNTIGTRSEHTYQTEHNISFEGNKRRKIVDNVPDRDDHSTYQRDQANEEIPSSLTDPRNFPITSAPTQPQHEPDEQLSSSRIMNGSRRSIQQEHLTSTTNTDENADSNTNTSQQLHQPPLTMTVSEFEDLQWLNESSSLTTNFDLNMTDLFQNSSWDPMLFDAFTQGQTSPQQMMAFESHHQ